MLTQSKIRDFSGNSYETEDFLKQVSSYEKAGFNCYVGTDSKITKNHISIATAICFYQPGAGGKIFYLKEKVDRQTCPSLRSRMMLEAFRSVEVATELSSYCKEPIEIHLDIGSTARSKTSAYEKELQAMVLGQGFGCKIKNESWASSGIADKLVKH